MSSKHFIEILSNHKSQALAALIAAEKAKDFVCFEGSCDRKNGFGCC